MWQIATFSSLYALNDVHPCHFEDQSILDAPSGVTCSCLGPGHKVKSAQLSYNNPPDFPQHTDDYVNWLLTSQQQWPTRSKTLQAILSCDGEQYESDDVIYFLDRFGRSLDSLSGFSEEMWPNCANVFHAYAFCFKDKHEKEYRDVLGGFSDDAASALLYPFGSCCKTSAPCK